MRRELVEIPLGDLHAVGTAHYPAARRRAVAVVLLNAGHVPRNGHGSLAMHLAEHLCARGWPVLRVDLPGLGDAPGPLPERIETFWLDLKEGGQSARAAQVAGWAADTFGVRHVVLGGVCGAGITSIFTADRFPNVVHSLLLIEPELFTSEPATTAAPAFAGASGAADAIAAAEAAGAARAALPNSGNGPRQSFFSLRRLTSSWTWMRVLSRRRANLKWMSLLQRLLLRASSRRGEMPERANMPLVEAWSRLSKRGVPMLVLTAEGLLWEAYFTRLRGAIHDLENGRALHISVPGANHVFSNGAAQGAVLEAVPAWLARLDSSIRGRETG